MSNQELATAPETSTLQAKRERLISRDDSQLAYLFDTARFEQLYRLARVMAGASLIPDHFRKDKQGELEPERVLSNCFLVVNQAVRWGMDPFAVAPETYSVGGKLAFQGKLVAAVVNARAGLKKRLEYTFSGAGENRMVTVSGTFQDELEPRTVTLCLKDAHTQNDMWRKDPDQKLIYSASVKWARRHCPEIVLGVSTEDDPERMPEGAAAQPKPVFGRKVAPEVLPKPGETSVEESLTTHPEPEPAKAPEPRSAARRSSTPDNRPPTALETLRRNMAIAAISAEKVLSYVEEQTGTRFSALEAISADVLHGLNSNWDGCKEAILDAKGGAK